MLGLLRSARAIALRPLRSVLRARNIIWGAQMEQADAAPALTW
jgi:hypothetical protein